MYCNALMIAALACSVVVPGVRAGTTVAHYRFEEGVVDSAATGYQSILDSTGNGRHGTPFGNPVYRHLAITDGFLALELDGNDDRIRVNDDGALALGGSMTLEAVVRLDGITSALFSQIIFRGDNRSGYDPYFLAINDSGKVVFHLLDESGDSSILVSPNAIVPGGFLHLAGTLDDATGTQSLYINGIEVASATTAVRPLTALDPTQDPGIGIGALQNSGQFFDGYIDEVRISNTALDPSTFLGFLPGDANFDGTVNALDLSVLAAHWDEIYNVWSEGDFSGDGRVNGIDLSILAANWLAGASSEPVSFDDAVNALALNGIPEPSSLMLFGIGASCLLRRREQGKKRRHSECSPHHVARQAARVV